MIYIVKSRWAQHGVEMNTYTACESIEEAYEFYDGEQAEGHLLSLEIREINYNLGKVIPR